MPAILGIQLQLDWPADTSPSVLPKIPRDAIGLVVLVLAL